MFFLLSKLDEETRENGLAARPKTVKKHTQVESRPVFDTHMRDDLAATSFLCGEVTDQTKAMFGSSLPAPSTSVSSAGHFFDGKRRIM